MKKLKLIRKTQFSLDELGIQVVKTRYTVKGEILLELWYIAKEVVQSFAGRLQEVLWEKVGMKKPKRITALLLLDLEEM